MEYLSVKNWSEFQHYKDRTPPWIKLHRDILNDYSFECLQDASKAHLMLIWVLASQLDNQIPADPKWIARKIGASGSVNLKPLMEQDDSTVLAKRSLETEAEAYKQETENTTSTAARFDAFWSIYPKKVEKKKARAIWLRRKLDVLADLIIEDTTRRSREDANWKAGFIPNATTYLNGDRWEDEIIAERKQDVKPSRLFVPKGDDELVPFAKQHGFPEPTKTETYHAYRQRLWGLVRQGESA